MNTFIYALIDPRDNAPRYIGKSDTPSKRYKVHIDLPKKGHLTKKEAWIKSLFNEGIKPIKEIIDEIPEQEWKFWEQHYISLYRSWGRHYKLHLR